FLIVFGHGAAVFRKTRLYAFERFLVQHQPTSEQRGGGLLSEVVVGRTESAGQYYQVAGLEQLGQRFFQPLRVISHDRLAILVYPERGEPARDERGVGIDYVAEQQFRTDRQNGGGFKLHTILLPFIYF